MPRRAIARLRSAPMRGHDARRHGRIREERGFALVVALMILMTLMLAMVAVGTGALDVNNQSTRQTGAVRASAAAAAGAQVALFRLNQTGGSTGATGSIGNGATYTYAISGVTGPTGSTNQCAGLWVQNAAQTLQQDCITSTGTVNGVSQRVQERVVAYAPTVSLYPVNGVFAVNGFASNGVTGTFDLGSNGPLGLTNANLSSLNGALKYLAGNLTQSQNANQMCTGTCHTTVLANQITVPTIADSVYASAATTNNDATGLTFVSNTSYTASTNVLSALNNSATVSFAPGTYYFCGINEGGFSNFTMQQSGAGLVRIYIASPSRPGSACAAGSGNIYNAGNSTTFNNGGVSSNLQLDFYGTPGCTTSCPSAITPINGVVITGDVFAPNSTMAPTSLTMTGAMVIGYMPNTNSNSLTFTFQAPVGGGGAGSTYASYYPSAQANCIPSTTTGGTAGAC